MDMRFFIGTADRRELEFEHGMHSCLVKQCYHQRFQSLYGGSPDGVGTTGTKRNRPVFRLPRLSRHKLGMRRHYTQKNTLARAVRRLVMRGSNPGCRFCCSGLTLPPKRNARQ